MKILITFLCLINFSFADELVDFNSIRKVLKKDNLNKEASKKEALNKKRKVQKIETSELQSLYSQNNF